jgi:hypothetical protein
VWRRRPPRAGVYASASFLGKRATGLFKRGEIGADCPAQPPAPGGRLRKRAGTRAIDQAQPPAPGGRLRKRAGTRAIDQAQCTWRSASVNFSGPRKPVTRGSSRTFPSDDTKATVGSPLTPNRW